MSRVHSPGYPNTSLPKAIGQARSIHAADRRNVIDRDVAAKHIGYSGQSGASDKALASLAHYGLLEKAGKGQTRVTQLAVDIIHPVSETARKQALLEAAYTPTVFAEIRDRFHDGPPSEGALKSWLSRENFLDRAIGPVVSAYMDTQRFLEQEEAFESGGPSVDDSRESFVPDRTPLVEGSIMFGGAKVGDLIQWESQGVLQLPKPLRVRLVSEDCKWVAVEGSQTGIPMNEVIVETPASTDVKFPTFPLLQEDQVASPAKGETEWMRNSLSQETNVRILARGDMGPKEIGKLIRLLEAQKAILEED
ncbi:hypothetical protein GGQ64_001651 [Rhizobium azooxidifex]|uniref:Uncharacterized protein n=1 Tax=Mycoplana azooxidifex TaxID=1636188 RepID=A0A7W6D5H9_9HYPH|nr:hypothetical protein [Mycoplana azooxidifex]MBB3976462.1 hypothetical protein [Mycoplana azooxidifex]